VPPDWHHQGVYWIVPDGSHIRPYGVVLYEMKHNWYTHYQFPVWERQGIFEDGDSNQLPYDDEVL